MRIQLKSIRGLLPAQTSLSHPERSRLSGGAKDLAWSALAAVLCCLLSLTLACSSGKANPDAEAPPKATVEPELDTNNFKVDRPQDFPLFTAIDYKSVPALNVTGVVQPDINRSEKLRQSAETQVYSDVDTAYVTLESQINLLQPYKQKYLAQAVRVRDTIFFSYQHGGAALIDFLNAESDYRTVQLSYVNLVGAYLTAAAQMNQAVGREVIQ